MHNYLGFYFNFNNLINTDNPQIAISKPMTIIPNPIKMPSNQPNSTPPHLMKIDNIKNLTYKLRDIIVK